MVTQLDSLFQTNQEQRLEHSKNPQQYFESESNLHAHLKDLQAVAAYPDQIPHFVDAGAAESLLAVLDHQNQDVCLEAISLLVELTDEEISVASPEAINKLCEVMIEN
jgi:beta-catenin-like protein 1